MTLPYVDPIRQFGDFGFSLKKSVKRAGKSVSKAAKKVVGSSVVEEVERAGQRTLDTGSPTTGVPVIVNPVGLVYGAVQGDPTSISALELGGAAAGLPPGLLSSGAGLVSAAAQAAGLIDAPGVVAGPGGPDAITIPDVAPETLGRLGWKQKVAIGLAVGVAAWFVWKKFRR